MPCRTEIQDLYIHIYNLKFNNVLESQFQLTFHFNHKLLFYFINTLTYTNKLYLLNTPIVI